MEAAEGGLAEGGLLPIGGGVAPVSEGTRLERTLPLPSEVLVKSIADAARAILWGGALLLG